MICLLLIVSINANAKCHQVRETAEYSQIVAKGETYREAQEKIQGMLPSIGLLQNLKLKQTKLSTKDSHLEVNELQRSVNAHFDYLLLSKCKYQGEYYIKATVPKEGVTYLPSDYALIIPDKLKDYAHLNKLCGGKKMVVVLSGPFAKYDYDATYHAHTLNQKGWRYNLFCGDVALRVKRCSKHNGCWSDIKIDNSFDEFKVFYIPTVYAQGVVRDDTRAWQLEMSKVFLSGF